MTWRVPRAGGLGRGLLCVSPAERLANLTPGSFQGLRPVWAQWVDEAFRSRHTPKCRAPNHCRGVHLPLIQDVN